MTCERQPRPQDLLVFQYTCRRHIGTKLGSLAHFERKSPMLGTNLNNRQFARWRHLATKTTILFVFPFIFRFFYLSEV